MRQSFHSIVLAVAMTALAISALASDLCGGDGPAAVACLRSEVADLKAAVASLLAAAPTPPPTDGPVTESPFTSAPSAPSSVFNVYAYGAAGDGKTDDTASFQAAIDAAYKASGGIVYAPTGQYLLAGSLQLRSGITLEGTYRGPTAHTGDRTPGQLLPTDGTVLLPTGGAGDADGPALISMGQDSALRGVVVYYPTQSETAVVPFPWTINCTFPDPTIMDVELLNAYAGIYAVGAHRHYIARVYGQPLFRGIFIDATYDIGRVYDVHFNPWWSVAAPVLAFQREHGVAFTVGRSDWQYMTNTFAWGYDIGYKFIETSTGSCNGNFLGIGADFMRTAAVYVDQCDPYGLLIANGEFTCFGDAQSSAPNPAQVVVTSNNTGTITFSNSAFWGPSNNIARLGGTGWVAFEGCVFDQWGGVNGSAAFAAINVTQGTGSLTTTGSSFMYPGGPQVSFSAAWSRAIITGNMVTGPTNIETSAVGNAVVENNADTDEVAAKAGGAGFRPAPVGRIGLRRHSRPSGSPRD